MIKYNKKTIGKIVNDKSGERGGTENFILLDCVGHANIDMLGQFLLLLGSLSIPAVSDLPSPYV